MLRRNRIYILPTGFGCVFIMGAFIMILVGASYQNNLVNLLAFFMLSLIFIAMVQTHNNLKDIQVEQTAADGGYAGQEFVVTTVLTNSSNESRFNLEARLKTQKPKSLYENIQPLISKSYLKLRSSYAAGKRGRYVFDDIQLSTIFPLGLFRAWIQLPAQTTVYIYPKPKGDRTLSQGASSDPSQGIMTVTGGEDYREHRRYNIGDPISHIDWKARAKGRPLLVKEFNEGAPAPLLLDWFSLEGLAPEDRLSQLAKWIGDAVLKKETFALRLPGLLIQPSTGSHHAQKCLEALASFEVPNAS